MLCGNCFRKLLCQVDRSLDCRQVYEARFDGSFNDLALALMDQG